MKKKKVAFISFVWLASALDPDLPVAGGSVTQKFPSLNGACLGHCEAGTPVMYGRLPL